MSPCLFSTERRSILRVFDPERTHGRGARATNLLRALGAVLRAAALAAVDAEAVKRAADDVIADTREVADAAAADEHDAVLLQVVLFAGDVGGHFLAVGEPNAGDLAERRVGLLGGHGLDLEAHAALLRAGLEVLDLVDLRQRAAR